MEFRAKVAGWVLLCAAFNCGALTLGRMRGVAIVGQPLEVSVQVQLDAGESASSLCIEADVFHADTRQEPGRVRVSVDAPQPLSQAATVRISSSPSVDEPIITVYLKAGCAQKSTRRYVLLADFPSEPVLPAAPVALPLVVPYVPAAAPSAVSASGYRETPATEAGANRKSPAQPAFRAKAIDARPAPLAKPVAAEKPAVQRSVPRKKPDVSAQVQARAPEKLFEKPKAAPPGSLSRLKLDSMVMLAERVTSLESSTTVPVAEVLRDSQRLQSLEVDMKTLTALAARNEVNLLELRARLQKAESERLPALWVYALAALVVSCLAAMAYLWSRQRIAPQAALPANSKDDWWTGSRGAPLTPASAPASVTGNVRDAGSDQTLATASTRPTVPVANSPLLPRLHDAPESEVDVSLVEMSASNFDKLMASGQSHSALRKGPLPAPVEPSRPQALQAEQVRSINSEELFDIRQQAEFFVSLGQTDQAVRILENRINENGESSPSLYLDLLKILHALGLRTDFREFREDFSLLFNGNIPEFASFEDEGKSLDEYPHVLAHIIALWPKPKVLMVIEASIFRDPWNDKGAPFDLAAFRELLLLHAIAQSSANADDDAFGTAAGGAAAPPLKSRDVDTGKSAILDVNLTEIELDSPGFVTVPDASPFEGPDFPKMMAGHDPAPVQSAVAFPPKEPLPDPNRIDFELPDSFSGLAGLRPKD